METKVFTLHITPRQADRARGNPKTGKFYNTPKYRKYQKELTGLLMGVNQITLSPIGGRS